MKGCKKNKGLMANAIYNELQEKEQKKFQEHLKVCSMCSEEYKNLVGLLGILDKRERPEMSKEFWDNYYLRLEDKIDAEVEVKKPLVKISWQRRWFLYPAAVMAVLVVGVAIALYLSLPGGREVVKTVISSMRQLSPAVADHFDNLKPLLIDYSNYTSEEREDTPEETVMVDKNTVKKLLLENQLLKRLMAKANNISVKQLMDELELILLEISNSNGDKEEIRRAVQHLIKDNEILFKMNVLNKREKKSLNI